MTKAADKRRDKIIAYISKYPNANYRDLADALGTGTAVISHHIARLIADGRLQQNDKWTVLKK